MEVIFKNHINIDRLQIEQKLNNIEIKLLITVDDWSEFNNRTWPEALRQNTHP